MEDLNERMLKVEIKIGELKVVSENQTQILREMKENRQREDVKREDDKKWLIRTVGAVIITALLGLII